MAVQVGRAVAPPDPAALAQRDLGPVDRRMSFVLGAAVALPPGSRHRAPDRHQILDQTLALLVGECGIGAAPEPVAHDEIAPVGRHRIVGAFG